MHTPIMFSSWYKIAHIYFLLRIIVVLISVFVVNKL
jgi:hypothetical protein